MILGTVIPIALGIILLILLFLLMRSNKKTVLSRVVAYLSEKRSQLTTHLYHGNRVMEADSVEVPIRQKIIVRSVGGLAELDTHSAGATARTPGEETFQEGLERELSLSLTPTEMRPKDSHRI